MNLPQRIYATFLTFVGLWCLAIVAAPALLGLGGHWAQSIVNLLYFGFSKICHQIDGRSLHIFGEKFGVCIRCTSIYFSFLAGIICYPFFKSLASENVPGRRWLLVAVVPMVVDAILNDLNIQQSTEATRAVTGSIAGFIFAFFILPLFIEAVRQLIDHSTLRGDSHYAGQT